MDGPAASAESAPSSHPGARRPAPRQPFVARRRRRGVRWDASRYAQVAGVQEAWGRRLIESHPWRGDEAVLDAGCGDGRLAALILERCPRGRVVAVDHDSGMVEKAGARLAAFGERARVMQADLQDLPPLPSVDVVFSNAVFHWVPDHDRLFRGLRGFLRPGGHLVAQCGGQGNLARCRAATEAVRVEGPFASFFADWRPPWHYEPPEPTRQRMEAAGFRDVQCWLAPAPTAFPDRDALRAFLRGAVLTPYNAVLPEAQRDAFANAVVDRLGGPPWELDYVRLEMRARA